jgi:hypothetical protein
MNHTATILHALSEVIFPQNAVKALQHTVQAMLSVLTVKKQSTVYTEILIFLPSSRLSFYYTEIE